jgi:hypothetical protein
MLNLSNRAVLGALLAVTLLTSGGSLVVNLLMNQGTNPVWWEGWLQNFSTEMFGAFLTFFLLELIVSTRDRRAQLIRQMGSRDNGIALQAVEELRVRGWLTDDSLQEALLVRANLQRADLYKAYLQGADLSGVNLQRADLSGANLQEAHLYMANLQGTNLVDANLQGTYLVDANLQGAELNGAELDENTTLPDDTNWTPGTDMARFTYQGHPEFWRSDAPWSPAYRGDDD